MGIKKRHRIAVVFGTRPGAIKLAPVIRALRRERGLDCHVCVTGQHREMLEQVLKVFRIRPDADLRVMRPGQSLSALTARTITALDAHLARVRPDLVLIQGDTTTTFCAALAALYQRLPVGHVEAGLRTGNLASPWPEEANRLLTTRLTALHFAPTATARRNLLREGVPPRAIFVTGNTVVDALLWARARARRLSARRLGLDQEWFGDGRRDGLVLITGHRRENFCHGLANICRAIGELARRFPKVRFVYPVHLNPAVRETVARLLGGAAARGAPGVSPGGKGPGRPARGKRCSAGILPASFVQAGSLRSGAGGGCPTRGTGVNGNIFLIEPLPYLPFVALMDRATLILSDSGGIQEEAPSLGKPVLVMRETTERPEAVATGTVRLVGADYGRIVREVSRLLTDPAARRAMSRARQGKNPYGDGKAAGRIVAVCRRWLSCQPDGL